MGVYPDLNFFLPHSGFVQPSIHPWQSYSSSHATRQGIHPVVSIPKEASLPLGNHPETARFSSHLRSESSGQRHHPFPKGIHPSVRFLIQHPKNQNPTNQAHKKCIRYKQNPKISYCYRFQHCSVQIHVKAYFLHFSITSITLSKSEFVIAVPDGKHNPLSNKSSATLPPTTRR